MNLSHEKTMADTEAKTRRRRRRGGRGRNRKEQEKTEPKRKERLSWMKLGLHSDPFFDLNLPAHVDYLNTTMEDREYSEKEVEQIFKRSVEASRDYIQSDWNMVVRKNRRVRHLTIAALHKLCN